MLILSKFSFILIISLFFIMSIFIIINYNLKKKIINYLKFEDFVLSIYNNNETIKHIFYLYLKKCQQNKIKIFIPLEYPIIINKNIYSSIHNTPFSIKRKKIIINEKNKSGKKLIIVKKYLINKGIISKYNNYSYDDMIFLLLILFYKEQKNNI